MASILVVNLFRNLISPRYCPNQTSSLSKLSLIRPTLDCYGIGGCRDEWSELQSTIGYRNYHSGLTDFERMVRDAKDRARRSIVIEDLTDDGYVWHQTDSIIKHRLFHLKSAQIDRWKIGLRRFLLVEFDSAEHLRYITRYLLHKHKIRLYDQVCFLSEHHIVRPPPSPSPQSSSSYPKSLSEDQRLNSLPSLSKIEFKDFTTQHSLSPPQTERPRKNNNNNNNNNGRSKSSGPTAAAAARSQVELIQQLLSLQNCQSEPKVNLELFIAHSSLQLKLRFFIVAQMESMIEKCWNTKSSTNTSPRSSKPSNLMDQYEIVPFGSDVSGFGTTDSDIDLCFIERRNSLRKRKLRQYRSVKLLRSVSNILQNSTIQLHRSMYLSQFSQIYRIFGAFVPIVKCRSRLLPDVNIDISIDIDVNSGFQMAEYLYHCSNWDRRVRPFVTLLKAWARHHNIIQSIPGEWFSSFQMTMLGIAFLQDRQIVPTITEFSQHFGARFGGLSSQSTTESRPLNSQFLLRDSSNSSSSSSSSQPISIEEIYLLLGQFFQFMVSYDFWQNGFDLNSGNSSIAKPSSSSSTSTSDRRVWRPVSRLRSQSDHVIYVQNPFIPELNICKTISENELERFLSFAQQTLHAMSSQHFVLDDIFMGFDDRLNFGQFY